MSSIKPLATVTILAVVGVILYVKINEGPAHTGLPAGQTWQSQPPVSIPALDTTAGNSASPFPGPPQTTSAPAAPGGTAPAWNANAAAPAAPPTLPPTSLSTTAAAPTGVDNLPPVPDIPDLPPLAGESSTSAAAPPMTNVPAGIPTADYSGTAPATAPPAMPGTVSGRVPSLGTATPEATTSTAPPVTSVPPTVSTPPPAAPSDAQVPSPYGVSAAVDAGPPPAVPATSPPDDRYAAPAAPPVDRYGADTTSPSQPTADRYGTAPPASQDDASFAAAWPVIEAALGRQELARAHLLLSQWYGDETLTPAEAQRVESLLSQLAGTVVYSTEHRLEPPYTAQPGDTLDSIARQYGVPWQLLAKINGIPTVDGVRPGQQLKVVRGPFSAVVELQKGQLTLTLDGRYAGRFPVRVEPGAAEGQWVVDQKLAAPSTASRYAAPTAQSGSTLVLRSDQPASPGTTLVIAGDTSQPAAIHVAPSDAEELSDILSIGSKVVVRR